VSGFSESVVEQAALAWLEAIGWQVRNAVEIAPGEPVAELRGPEAGRACCAER
jgi:type I restriction enzyme R subunit